MPSAWSKRLHSHRTPPRDVLCAARPTAPETLEVEQRAPPRTPGGNSPLGPPGRQVVHPCLGAGRCSRLRQRCA
eukprot:15456853-Alexandrium_andersonii.AAC.1